MVWLHTNLEQFMKSLKLLIAVFLLLFTTAYSSLYAYAEYSFSYGLYYDTFFDDRSPQASGSEWTLPVSIQYEQRDLFFRIDTAYSHAMVKPGSTDQESLASLTDTFCTFSYSFSELPVSLLFGIDVNFPTGKERLSQEEKIVEAGEKNDLFKVDNFGEGLNLGFHLGIVKELADIRAGIYNGYTFYGEYDPTQDIPDDDFNPGEQLLIMAAFDWQVAPQVLFNSFLAYSHFGEDHINNDPVFQEGDKLVFGGALYMQQVPLSVNISWQNAVQAKNDELVEELLETETENSNRLEFLGSLDLSYLYSPSVVLHWLGDIRYYGESKRRSLANGRPFEGRRLRYALGAGFSYTQDQQFSYHGLAKFFVLHQEPNVFLEDEVTFQGMNFGIGMTYTF